MKNKIVPLLVVLAIAAVAAAGFYYFRVRQSQNIAAAPTPVESQEQAPENPVEDAPAAKKGGAESFKPVPSSLEESDGASREALSGLIGAGSFDAFFVPTDLIRHIVVTVDNLPEDRMALRLRPIKPTPGQFAVTAGAGKTDIAAANAARYMPFVQLVESIDTDRMVALYIHFYPLFQQAYRDLGYPNGYFNDRVILAIDHLLATPDVPEPIALTQPRILYEYADPGTEARSSGQKILIRMGGQNEAKLKQKLRDFRQSLTRKPPK